MCEKLSCNLNSLRIPCKLLSIFCEYLIYEAFFFSDIEIDPLPTVSRTLQLLVTAPDNGDVLTEVQIGQLFRLRLVYDNTVNNSNYFNFSFLLHITANGYSES